VFLVDSIVGDVSFFWLNFLITSSQ
jgi:hypothetical protein